MTTYDVTGHLTAKVRLGRGRLEVEPGPDGSASATVTALNPADDSAIAAAERATIDMDGDELVVELPRLDRESSAPEVQIVIVVPVGTDLRVAAGDLEVTADQLTLGDVRLRMGNGDAHLADCTGAVDVKAGNVSLAVGDAAALTVAAGNADVRAGHVGDAALRSGAGSMHLASSTGRVAAKGGQLELTIASTASGSVDFRTAAGSATIGVAAGTDVQLDLVSAVGDVSCSLPVGSEAPSQGAPLSLRLHTGAGDLRVHRAGEEPPPLTREPSRGFPDVGRIVEEAMSNVQVQLDRAGLSNIRIDATGDRSRPGWADRLERAVRGRTGTTRIRRVGSDGEDVTEHLVWVDGEPLPVDDGVSEEQVRALRGAGFDRGLVAQLPVEGPWSLPHLLTVCRAGLAGVLELVRQLPLEGPLTSEQLAALVEDGLEDVVRRMKAAHVDGPIDPDDVLPRFGKESD